MPHYVIIRYFTWYKAKMNEKDQDEAPCQLVGFNLKQACFNLESRCVLLKECEKFNDTCHKCRVSRTIPINIAILLIHISSFFYVDWGQALLQSQGGLADTGRERQVRQSQLQAGED